MEEYGAEKRAGCCSLRARDGVDLGTEGEKQLDDVQVALGHCSEERRRNPLGRDAVGIGAMFEKAANRVIATARRRLHDGGHEGRRLVRIVLDGGATLEKQLNNGHSAAPCGLCERFFLFFSCLFWVVLVFVLCLG